MELLIVSVLFFGLLTLVSVFVVRGKRLAVKTESFASVQREAIKLARAIGEDFNRATDKQHNYNNDTVMFLSSKPVDQATEPVLEFDAATGQVLWKQWVAYYLHEPEKVVKRFNKPLPTPVSDPLFATGAWDMTEFPTLALSPNEGRAMAKGITEFAVSRALGPNMWEFRIVAEGEVPLGNMSKEDKKVRVEIETGVRLGVKEIP